MQALTQDMERTGYTQRKRHQWMEEALMATFLRCPTLSGPDVRANPEWTEGPQVRIKVPVVPRLADDIRVIELFIRDCDRECRAPLARILSRAIAFRLNHPDQFRTSDAIQRLKIEYARSDISRVLGS